MMEVGASTACLFTKAYNEDAINIYNQYGISVVEVFLATFSEYEKDFVDELKRRKGNLRVHSVHTLNQQFEPELFSRSPRALADAHVIFDKIVYAMKGLDADYYTFHGPARLKRLPYNINYETFGKRLDELNARIVDQNGKGELVYENVHWSYFNSPEFFDQLKGHTAVKTCLDIKQAMQSHISCYDYIDSMGDRLKNVHLCDFDEDGKLKLCGRGSFDFVTLFKYLSDKGYDGPLMLEVYPESFSHMDELMWSIEHVQNCLYKALH